MINDVLDNGLTTSEEKEVLSTSLHPSRHPKHGGHITRSQDGFGRD